MSVHKSLENKLMVLNYYNGLLVGNANVNIKNLNDALVGSRHNTTLGHGDVYPVTTARQIIATIIMFGGMGFLGTFISIVGVKLISRKLKKDLPRVATDTKQLIKERIDEIEQLNQSDFELLLRMLKNLHDSNTYDKN